MITEQHYREAETIAECLLSNSERRSPEYREGVISRCAFLLAGKPKGNFPPCPYSFGTAQADAWIAGSDDSRIGLDYMQRLEDKQ